MTKSVALAHSDPTSSYLINFVIFLRALLKRVIFKLVLLIEATFSINCCVDSISRLLVKPSRHGHAWNELLLSLERHASLL